MNQKIHSYGFWPDEKVDALFSGVIAKRISYRAFFLEMKKMYERALHEEFDIIDELEAAVQNLPVKRQYELLTSIKVRKCPVRGKQNKEG